jgi:hypothetical protein
MPLTEAQIKGNALEEAARLIEQTIFRNNPATKEAVITIETKKTIVVDGVRHEIDLFITIDYSIAGKEIYIFECKNWVKGVGKNPIINSWFGHFQVGSRNASLS